MKPVWINIDNWDDPIDHYERSWYGGITPIVRYTILAPFAPPYLVDQNGRHWKAKDGILSDENSVPWLFTPFLPRNYGEPACFLHDQIYADPEHRIETRLSINEPWQVVSVSRLQADMILFDGWTAAPGTEPWRNRAGYLAVRAWAWTDWK